jgi:hypothetical protein
MSPAVKNGLMLVVLVGALALAGFFFNRSNKESVYPDDKSMATQWICAKCQKHYGLTPAQYKEWIDSKDKVRRDPNFPGKLVVFWCDDCQAFSVVRAAIDRKTMTWYPAHDSAGNPWKPKAESKGESKKPAAKESPK